MLIVFGIVVLGSLILFLNSIVVSLSAWPTDLSQRLTAEGPDPQGIATYYPLYYPAGRSPGFFAAYSLVLFGFGVWAWVKTWRWDPSEKARQRYRPRRRDRRSPGLTPA